MILNYYILSISTFKFKKKTYLKSHGVMTISITVLHFLFFTFLESTEIILNKEGRVKFADRHLVVHWKDRFEV